jgi:2-keto-4-pentenoate hydratase/2-oxohepta-3-ene-1,7-dioic acid hydratase in catechol pathway
MNWLRFLHQGQPRRGVLLGAWGDPAAEVLLHDGDDTLAPPAATEQRLPLAALTLLQPVRRPGQIIGLWNNFRAAAEKNGWAQPAEPLYFLKSPHSLLAPGGVIAAPPAAVGRVAYEGELAVVIGRRAHAVPLEQAASHMAGFCCANDVTALELLHRDASFAQWARAKSLPGFCPLGPLLVPQVDVATAEVVTRVGGRERQRFALSDMFFSPTELVARLSQDLVLEAGDIILCGTSVGVLPMKPGAVVEVEISGLGVLSAQFGLPAD